MSRPPRSSGVSDRSRRPSCTANPLEMADRHVLYKMAVRKPGRSGRNDGLVHGQAPKRSAGQLLSRPPVASRRFGRPGLLVIRRPGTPLRPAPARDRRCAPPCSGPDGLVRPDRELLPAHPGPGRPRAGARTWGIDHRFVSVRVVGHTADAIRLEFRLPGADTNPYLTLAGLVASIVDGLDNEIDPRSAHGRQPVTTSLPATSHKTWARRRIDSRPAHGADRCSAMTWWSTMPRCLDSSGSSSSTS